MKLRRSKAILSPFFIALVYQYLANLIVNAGSEGVDLNDLTNPLETLVNESLPKAVGKL